MRIALAAWAASLTLLVAAAVAGGAWLVIDSAPSSGPAAAAAPHSHNVIAWELRHFPEKWLYKVGGLFTDKDDALSDDEAIAEYFSLMAEIVRLERDDPNSPDLETAVERAADLENAVEDIIEGRVTAVLEDEGLTIGPPPFTDLAVLFPPVDFELDASPRLLVVSPRSRIERSDSYLLEPGLNIDTVREIETESEEGGDVSALVVQTGGVAMYPSVVSSSRDYPGIVETVFHEWLHQHLILFPLGQSYFAGGESRTLNESVANIAGRELARLYFERYDDTTAEPASQPTPSPSFDFRSEMRNLRLDVESFLEVGKIENAEALMERKRDEFEENGVYIRRINQAYFAFYGSYADTPASIDPIGPKLESLLADAGSPGEFVRRSYSLTSAEDLDAALDGKSG